MKLRRTPWLLAASAALWPVLASSDQTVELKKERNAAGWSRTHSTDTVTGDVDPSHPFFQPLGASNNGRACVSCHAEGAGWTLTPAFVKALFKKTGGLDPLFRTNDGSNRPDADVSTLAARTVAYSMLLDHALIRVERPVPEGANFQLVAVSSPHHADDAAALAYAQDHGLSLFRRPLPAANLAFLTTVMWDGRETLAGESILTDLSNQARGATIGHAAAPEPTLAQREAIVAFETSLFATQIKDNGARDLDVLGSLAGPVALARQSFTAGENDPNRGCDRVNGVAVATGCVFPWVTDPVRTVNPGPDQKLPSYDMFAAWPRDARDYPPEMPAAEAEARALIARGEDVFNKRTFVFSKNFGLTTCSHCHSATNAGSSSTGSFFNIGTDAPNLVVSVADPSRRPAVLEGLPVYRVIQIDPVTRQQARDAGGNLVPPKLTTDPGRALTTGLFAHVGQFKVPGLSNLAARAPYFHNGFATTIEEVVDFYEDRFLIKATVTAGYPADRYSDDEKRALVAFLKAL